LLAEAARLEIAIDTGHRVRTVDRAGERFTVTTDAGRRIDAARIVLATGGLSLPKSGSDGHGYAIAAALGHRIVETTPALAPLLLDGDTHVLLSGVGHPAMLTLRVEGSAAIQLEGPLLWTHFGASGPVVLNMSRHWLRAVVEGARHIELWLNVCPGDTFESVEQWWLGQEKARPRAQVSNVLATLVPAALALAWLSASGVAPDATMAHVSKEERRRVIHRLTGLRLTVRNSRGYDHAEVTAGGVALDEIDAATMESRRCPGLFLVGEVLDVDGRLGGFNFQWAWSSAWVASRAIARPISSAVTRK
jgi:predicted Rossmann fold flavoprotein